MHLSGCDIQGNFVFLLEDSTSLGQSNYGKMIDFVVNVCNRFNIESGKVAIGLVTYSNKLHSIIPVYLYKNKVKLLDTIKSLKAYYKGGIANTTFALIHLKNAIPRNQYRNTSAILLNNGKSSNIFTINSTAKELIKLGVNLYLVYIRNDSDILEHWYIGNGRSLIYQTSINRLNETSNDLTNKICGGMYIHLYIFEIALIL